MVNRLKVFLGRFRGDIDGSNMFINMLLFGVSVQLGCFVLWVFNILPAMGIAYPYGSVVAMTNLKSVFSITPWTVVIGVSGSVIGILALLFRAQTYALYAILIFAVGVFFSVLSPFFLAIPNTIGALLPGTTNPLAYTNGVYDPNYSGASAFGIVIGVIFAVALFIFVFELFLQRKVS